MAQRVEAFDIVNTQKTQRFLRSNVTTLILSCVEADESLRESATNNIQNELLELAGSDIAICGPFDVKKIKARPSYLNAILIQSRGIFQVPSCTHCSSGKGKFTACHRIPGVFGGACASCKWSDWAQKCTYYNKFEAKDLSQLARTSKKRMIEELESFQVALESTAGATDEALNSL